MTYKKFTASQLATVQALVAEMKDLSALWIDTPCYSDPNIETRADWIYRSASDWDQKGSFQERAAYIKDLRASVRACRRSQADIFAAIKALGLICRKTEGGDFRVADPAIADLEVREYGAAYCSDLAEALATAYRWAQDRADADDRIKRDRLLDAWQLRAAEILAAKRAVYGDSFATATEAELQASDPLAWLELIEDHCMAEIGLTYQGRWADEYNIERAKAAVAAEDLEREAARARLFTTMTAHPSDIPETAQHSAEAVAQLIKAAKAARFALESAIYLQGLRPLIPAALDLINALEPFESDIEAIAEAQMIAATLSGRGDLAA